VQVYLVVVSGPEASRSYPLPSGRTHIGIDPSNEIVLDDRYVSRHHCVIDLNDDGALVTDLGSKNGTCINGRPIQQAPLRPGDRLTVGLTDLVLSKKPAPSGSLSAESSGTETVEVEVLRKGDWLATLPAGAVAGMVSKGFAGARRGWEVLRAGYQLARQLHTAEDVEGLSRRVLQHLLAVTEADWGAVFLRREDGELELCCDLSAEGEQAEPVVYSRSVLAEALSNCSPVLSGELGRDGRFAASESVREGALQSVLCVPLLTESEGAERLERSETTSEGAERPERSETSGEPLGAVYLVSRTKPFAFAEEELAWLEAVAGQLSVALETLFARRQLEEENARLRRQSVLQHGLIGETEAIQEVLQFIRQVAPAEATVLIQGETGTGKELVSRAIHYNSRRQDGPFVCINSAALPRDLIESELFGHEKGAFTGAIRAKPGKFELASGGTVFLDEVGELAPSTQAKLLRVLEGTTRLLPRGHGRHEALPLAGKRARTAQRHRARHRPGQHRDRPSRGPARLRSPPPSSPWDWTRSTHSGHRPARCRARAHPLRLRAVWRQQEEDRPTAGHQPGYPVPQVAGVRRPLKRGRGRREGTRKRGHSESVLLLHLRPTAGWAVGNWKGDRVSPFPLSSPVPRLDPSARSRHGSCISIACGQDQV